MDLEVIKTSPEDDVLIFAPLTYTITATNIGAEVATSVQVRDIIPANCTYVSASATQGTVTFSGGEVICEAGTLPSLASTTITVTVTPNSAGNLVNTATVTSADYEMDPSNNTGSRTVNVQAGTIQGKVFLDLNSNGFADTTEAGTGQDIYVKVIDTSTPSGPAIGSALADPSTGEYSIGNIPGGTYNIVLSTNDTLSDVTPTVPTGYLGTNEPDFSIDSQTLTYVDTVDLNFGVFEGSTLSAYVFIDDGIGGGNRQ